MKRSLNIFSVSAEVYPFSKTGGLSDVAASLPQALARLGHNVSLITPLYASIDKQKYGLEQIYRNEEVVLNSKNSCKVDFWRGKLSGGVSVFFVAHKEHFGRKKSLYGHGNDNERFMLFCAASLKLINRLGEKPDIIHCHDWHSGLIPYYHRNRFIYARAYPEAKTIFTIHNLVFQFESNWWEVPAKEKDFGRSRLPHLDNPALRRINFAKRGILSADIVNTVSEQYRDEIMTKHFGQDLHRILSRREDSLHGIVNGIEHISYNPASDQALYKNFSVKSLSRRPVNKEYLQKKLGLPLRRDVPLFCSTSRVVFQKGFQLLGDILDRVLGLDVQLVVLGDGDKRYIAMLKKAMKKYPEKIVWLPFRGNEEMETQIYAGADMFLLPSHHEPCGINQLIAMRYGCVPIVRRTGGLHDTVENYKAGREQGNGFSFSRFDPFSLYGAIIRSLETYPRREAWRALVERCMHQSSSWEIPAKKYVELYRLAMEKE